MDKVFSNDLHKKQFAFPLNALFKFISAGIVTAVFFGVALFIFHTSAGTHFFRFHPEILKLIAFALITGALFFYIFQQAQGQETDLPIHDYFRKNPSPMWICDSKTGKLVEVNETASIAFGYSRHEFLLMNFDDICIDEAVNSNNVNEQFSNRIIKIQCKEGVVAKVAISSFNIHYKKRKAVLIISNDIVEPIGQRKFIDNEFVQQINDRIAELTLVRKELEVRNREINTTNDELINLNNLLQSANKKLTMQSAMAIKLKTDQLKNIIDKIRDSIWSFDLTGKEENYVSSSAVSLFGLSKEEIIDRPNFWFEFVHPMEKEIVFEKLKDLENKDETEFSYRMLDSLKKTTTFHQKINITRDLDGNAVRMECIGWPL